MMDRVSRRGLLAGAGAMGALATGCSQSASTPSDALGDRDATGIAAAIRDGEITAAEAMEAAIARSERVNGQLNFIAEPLSEYGRARAGETLSGPFAGVPTLIKDLMDMTGHATRYGSRAFANNVSTEQSPYMDALLAAGLAPFGKSTTPEFGLTATTETLLQGATPNPWNIAHSGGGSSGGAAVAVAARVVPMAHASDGGGSIRIPASCNGLFGLKPSRGRSVIAGRADPGIDISVNGCISISVRDSAGWLAVTEASGEGAAFPPVGVVSGPSTQRLRIMLDIPNARGDEPTPEVRAAVEDAAALCRELGHTVIEGRRLPIDGPRLVDDFILIWAAGAAEVAALVQSQAPAGTALDQVLEPLTLALAAHAQTRGQAAIVEAIGRLRAVEAQYASAFGDVDVHLSPVLTQTPLPLGVVDGAKGFEIMETLSGYVNTPVQNVAGAAAMSVPLAWSEGGLPIGIHFAGPAGGERRLLELAYELEQARPWASRRPPVNAG